MAWRAKADAREITGSNSKPTYSDKGIKSTVETLTTSATLTLPLPAVVSGRTNATSSQGGNQQQLKTT